MALAEAGADVVITSRTEEDLAEVAARVAKAGRKAHVVLADLSDPQAAADLAHAAVEVFGRLDIVVNNVGGTHPRPLLETTTDFLEEAFRFNVSGAHALTTAAAPFMLEAGGGAIVNISSLVGRVAGRGWAAYGTAKAALSHYTRLAALDLAPRIRVNAIEPGSIATSALAVRAPPRSSKSWRVRSRWGAWATRAHRRDGSLSRLTCGRLRNRQESRSRRRESASPRRPWPTDL